MCFNICQAVVKVRFCQKRKVNCTLPSATGFGAVLGLLAFRIFFLCSLALAFSSSFISSSLSKMTSEWDFKMPSYAKTCKQPKNNVEFDRVVLKWMVNTVASCNNKHWGSNLNLFALWANTPIIRNTKTAKRKRVLHFIYSLWKNGLVQVV